MLVAEIPGFSVNRESPVSAGRHRSAPQWMTRAGTYDAYYGSIHPVEPLWRFRKNAMRNTDAGTEAKQTMTSDLFDNSDNPYAAPESSTAIADRQPGPGGIRIEGDLVLVGKTAHLPEICVVSGETDDLIQLTKQITYVSPIVIFVFLLNGLLGLILYVVIRKQTMVTFYMSRTIHSKKQWKMFYGLFCLAATVVVVLGLASGFVGRPAPELFFVPGVLFIAGLVFLVQGANVLGVKRFQKPEAFWLKGCKSPFFDTLALNPEAVVQSGY